MPASDLKGELLVEEPKYNRRAKQSRYYQYTLGLLVVGVLALVLGLYLRFFLVTDVFSEGDVCVGPFMLILISISFVCIMFAIYFYMLGRKRVGVRLYKNGISYPSSLGFKEVFYPFAEFKSFEKQEHFLYGGIYVFTLGPNRSLAVRQKTLDLENYVDYIKERIERPKEVTEVDLEFEKKAFRRAETLWYVATASLALVLTFIIAGFAISEWDPYEFLLIVGYLGPILINTVVFIVGLRLIYELKSKSWGFGINLKVVAGVFGVSLLIFFAAISATWILVSDINNPDIVKNDYPGPSVLNETFYENMDFVLDGDITLLTGDLTFMNCSIVFNCTEHKEYGIWTGPVTRLTMINTVVKPRLEDAAYTMELHGSARLTECSFFNIWGDVDEEHLNGDGGLKIHNDDVVIEQCLITDCRSNGILIDHCSPRIINNTIQNCDDDGLEIHGGNAYIYGNRIQHNDYGICAFGGSRAVIDSNAFIDNEYGLAITESELRVSNNHFIDHGEAALVEIDSDSVLRNNEYIGKKTSQEAELMANQNFNQICLIMFFLLTLISFLILFIINRRLSLPPRAKK